MRFRDRVAVKPGLVPMAFATIGTVQWGRPGDELLRPCPCPCPCPAGAGDGTGVARLLGGEDKRTDTWLAEPFE